MCRRPQTGGPHSPAADVFGSCAGADLIAQSSGDSGPTAHAARGIHLRHRAHEAHLWHRATRIRRVRPLTDAFIWYCKNTEHDAVDLSEAASKLRTPPLLR